jgi:hypothetical protein
MKLDREKCFVDAIPRSGYLWCLDCERAYRYGKYRLVGRLQMCPYDGCSGDTVVDGLPWEIIRKEHRDYPVKPVLGKVYPLY